MSGPHAANAPDPGRDSGWSVSLREAGLILLLSLVLTGAWWLRAAERLPLRADPTVYQLELAAPLLDTARALEYYDEGVHLFVDTRAAGITATIPGSLFIREASFDDDLVENFDFIFPEDQFILFGDGNLTRTSNVAARLLERGYENLTILQGGLDGWRQAGGEVSPVTPEYGS